MHEHVRTHIYRTRLFFVSAEYRKNDLIDHRGSLGFVKANSVRPLQSRMGPVIAKNRSSSTKYRLKS